MSFQGTTGAVTASWLQPGAGIFTVKFNVFHYPSVEKAREEAFKLAAELDESIEETEDGNYLLKDHGAHVSIVTESIPEGQARVAEGSFGIPEGVS